LTGGAAVDVPFTWPVSSKASSDTAFKKTDYDIAVEFDIAFSMAPLCVWEVKSKRLFFAYQIILVGG